MSIIGDVRNQRKELLQIRMGFGTGHVHLPITRNHWFAHASGPQEFISNQLTAQEERFTSLDRENLISSAYLSTMATYTVEALSTVLN